MIGKEIIAQKPMTLTELKNTLQKIDGELSYEQKVSLEYAKEFGKSSVKKIDDAIKKMVEMGIDEDHAISIVNVKPTSKEVVNLILEKTRTSLKDAQIKEILSIVANLEGE